MYNAFANTFFQPKLLLMKLVFTLFFILVASFQPIFSQGNWWEDLDLPQDTVFVADCQDIDLIATYYNGGNVFLYWGFPDFSLDNPVVGNMGFYKTYDADSNCTGGIMVLYLVHWELGEVYEHERVIAIDPNLPGPCGEFFSFVDKDIEDGLQVSDLDPDTDGLSFYFDLSDEPIFIQPNKTDTFHIALFHSPGPSACFVTIEVQVNWLEDLNLPTDTIFLSSCADIEPLNDFEIRRNIFREWVCLNCHEFMDITGTYHTEKVYDADSQCVGGTMMVTILNWLNLEVHQFERVIVIDSDLSGPCGEFFYFDWGDIENGIELSDIYSGNDDISFFPDGSQGPLQLDISESDTLDIPIFQTPGPSVCFITVAINVGPPCLDTFIFEINENFQLNVGTEHCNRLTLDHLQLKAEYYCMDFNVGFLRPDNRLSNRIDLALDLDKSHQTKEITIAMRTSDGGEFFITFDLSINIDSSLINGVYLYTDDPYLQEGDITYVGIGGRLTNAISIQGELLLNGSKVLEVLNRHPDIHFSDPFYNSTETFFRFLFFDPAEAINLDDGEPWFVLKMQALEDGFLSDLIDTENHTNFNQLFLETERCVFGIPFNFNFQFSQDLIFSNTEEPGSISDINLFPNPAADVLWIEAKHDHKIKSIGIYDLSGKLVLFTKQAGNQLDVSQLLPGYYRILISTEKGEFTGGFIKN